MHLLFAAAENPGLFQALGLDWKLLIEQALAFLLLLFILGKFVYPPILKMLEERRNAIEEGLSHAKKADEALKKAEEQGSDVIKQARAEADSIIDRGKKEAQAIVARAEDQATQRAERIIEDAQTQIQSDVEAARQSLRDETVKLVAEATEAIISEKLDAKKDASLIKRALAKEQV